MAEENNAWVFDSLIGFLHGPIWNAPLQTFIEEKSLSEFNKLFEKSNTFPKLTFFFVFTLFA